MFISSTTIKGAVQRLAVSSASSTLADYLIFKRALRLAHEAAGEAPARVPDSVATGMRSPLFVQAINELTLCVEPEHVGRTPGHPYYSPFGSKRDQGRGYKSVKYPSNGPSDTVGGWQSRAGKPLVVIEGTSPKEYRFEPRAVEQLEDFFIIKGATHDFSGNKPLLTDVAVWWFRSTDIEPRFGTQPDATMLGEAFIQDLGLSDAEVQAFFSRSQPSETAQEGPA